MACRPRLQIINKTKDGQEIIGNVDSSRNVEMMSVQCVCRHSVKAEPETAEIDSYNLSTSLDQFVIAPD